VRDSDVVLLGQLAGGYGVESAMASHVMVPEIVLGVSCLLERDGLLSYLLVRLGATVDPGNLRAIGTYLLARDRVHI